MMNAWLSMEFDSIDYSHDITTEKKQRLAQKNIKTHMAPSENLEMTAQYLLIHKMFFKIHVVIPGKNSVRYTRSSTR